MKKILSIIICFGFFIPSFILAQTGNHFGEQKFLSYGISYFNVKGDTVVDETGITFIADSGSQTHQNTILPESYFRHYPLYFGGDTMGFLLTIKNEGKRTYRNLKIETFQEFLNIEGNEGEAISADNQHEWFVSELRSGQEIVLYGEFIIPTIGQSGLDQTHLRIYHWSGIDSNSEKNTDKFTEGQIILEDFQAGLWCPFW